MSFQRQNGRALTELRPIKLQYDVYSYADASLLFEIGNTKILTAATLQQTVPSFLKGQRTGWLSAEYAMLPCATPQRNQRESSIMQRNARSVEISRLIGRSLRTVLNLEKIGERSILVDCDVLQADGSTRVACVTAASLVLKLAIQRWAEAGLLDNDILKEDVAAVSVGVVEGQNIVDLDYNEDNKAEADFNFVMTDNDNFVEVQGTCEKKPINTSQFDEIKCVASKAIKQVFVECKKIVPPTKKVVVQTTPKFHSNIGNQQKPGMFALGNRLNKLS